MSIKLKTFAKSSVTYGEMIEALVKLGYRQEFDGKYYRYINDEHNSIILVPVCSPDELVEKVYLETDSRRLYNQGVVADEDGLIRLIQKNRLKKTKKLVNAEEALA